MSKFSGRIAHHKLEALIRLTMSFVSEVGIVSVKRKDKKKTCGRKTQRQKAVYLAKPLFKSSSLLLAYVALTWTASVLISASNCLASISC